MGKLNALLDDLVRVGRNKRDQAGIFTELMQLTTPEQMAWIIQIVLKSLKVRVALRTQPLGNARAAQGTAAAAAAQRRPAPRLPTTRTPPPSQINASENTVFKVWHVDAMESYNNSGNDLRYIFNQLIDPNRPARTVCRCRRRGTAGGTPCAQRTRRREGAAPRPLRQLLGAPQPR